MNDEHGGFWVGVCGTDTDKFVLEFYKSLTLFGNFGEDEIYKINLNKIESAKEYFNLLLNGEIDELREKPKNK